MPLTVNKNPYALAVKVALVVWGIASLLQGAGLSFSSMARINIDRLRSSNWSMTVRSSGL
jgi:hypothetical protein